MPWWWSAECCEIYNYCGVLCYDSIGASGDSTSQRQAWETFSARLCVRVCVQTQRQHSGQNIPLPCTYVHSERPQGGEPRSQRGALLPPSGRARRRADVPAY